MFLLRSLKDPRLNELFHSKIDSCKETSFWAKELKCTYLPPSKAVVLSLALCLSTLMNLELLCGASSSAQKPHVAASSGKCDCFPSVDRK